jgi:hypothetical protein
MRVGDLFYVTKHVNDDKRQSLRAYVVHYSCRYDSLLVLGRECEFILSYPIYLILSYLVRAFLSLQIR